MNQISVKPPKAFAMLGINSRAGYDLMRKGELKSVKITGNRYLVPLASIEEYMNRKTE